MTNRLCAVVTGGTSGIGLAIAIELESRGFTPILNYHADEGRAELALSQFSGSGTSPIAVRADVTTEAGAQLLINRAGEHGEISILVNCVGGFLYKSFLETSLDEWRDSLGSCLLSTVLCCQQVLPLMRARRSGQIINIGSLNAHQVRARPNTLPYAVAKSGISHLTKTLAKTEGAFGIRVNAVNPGFIDGGEHTAQTDSDRVPLGRLGLSSEVAQAVGFLTSEAASYINGAILDVHGGALL